MEKIVSIIFMAISGLLHNEENRWLAVGIAETIALAVLAVILFVQHHPVKASVLTVGAVTEVLVIATYLINKTSK